jgi:hypothetical protein
MTSTLSDAERADALDRYRTLHDEFVGSPSSLIRFLEDRWQSGVAIRSTPAGSMFIDAIKETVRCADCGRPLSPGDLTSGPVLNSAGEHRYICHAYEEQVGGAWICADPDGPGMDVIEVNP